jgi:hypothetical protein
LVEAVYTKPAKADVVSMISWRFHSFLCSILHIPFYFLAISGYAIYSACTDRQLALIRGTLSVLIKERGGKDSRTIALVRQPYLLSRPYLLSHKSYVRAGEADSG